MATEQNHYQVLGVHRGAPVAEIRRAYRALARRHHPDVSGQGSSVDETMSRINDAWSVLSDRQRRARYDAMLDGGSSATAREQSGNAAPDFEGRRAPLAVPARFPWRSMVVMGVIGSVIVLIGHAVTKPAPPGTPDQLITAGSCVDIDDQQMAVEVSCGGPHQAVVSQLIATDRICPTGTEPHRDRQGMGIACVIPTARGAGVQP